MDALRLTFALIALLLAAPAAAIAHAPPELDLTGVPQREFHLDPVGSAPDRMVTQSLAADTAPSATGLPTTWCGAERTSDDTANAAGPANAARVKVIYAYAADQPNRFDQLKDKLQANVSLLSRYVAQQSGDRRTVRFDMGTHCGPEYVDIQTLALPRPRASYVPGSSPDFNTLAADVRAAVAASYPGRVNWMVYADDMRAGGVAGTGELYWGGNAETPGTSYHDDGRLVGAVWGRAVVPATEYADVGTMLHEITHNFGGVQPNAPHSSGAMHCNDEYDVMCYADGGPSAVMTYPCPTTNAVAGFPDTYDCGGDDYFNPNPAPSSYLATHWNVYDVSFLGSCADELADACATEPPTGPQSTTAAAPAGWQSADYSVPLSGIDPSGITRYEWQVDGSPVETTATATVTGEGTFTLSHRVGSATEWSAWRHEPIRIDKFLPSFSLGCPTGWQAVAAACTATANDSGSGVARIEYVVDGALGSVAAASAQLSAPDDGAHPVFARAVDVAGRASQWVSGTLRQDRADPSVDIACAPDGADHRCTVAASDATGVQVTYAVGGSGLQPMPVGAVTVPAGATLTAVAIDGSGRQTVRTATMPVSAWTGRLPLTGAGGRALARASVRVDGATGALAVPAVKLAKGRYTLRLCAPGVRCRTFTQTLRHKGLLRSRTVAFPAPARAAKATVRLSVRRGRRTVTVGSGSLTVPAR
jgi:hypothetical protein